MVALGFLGSVSRVFDRKVAAPAGGQGGSAPHPVRGGWVLKLCLMLTLLGAGACGGGTVSMANQNDADATSETTSFDIPTIDVPKPPIDVLDVLEGVDVPVPPKDVEGDEASAGDIPVPPNDVEGDEASAGDIPVPPNDSEEAEVGTEDIPVPPNDSEEAEVGTEDIPVPPADVEGDGIVPPDAEADAVVPPADVEADAITPPVDAEGDAVVPPLDAADAADAAAEVDAGTVSTVPAGYTPPVAVVPDYLQADLPFWLQALPQVWDSTYAANYLTHFVDSQGQDGLVVMDPVSGNMTSEGVSYGMKGSAGTALMLATFGTLEGGDFQKAVDLQVSFNQLLLGYQEMQKLGNGLGAWNVVIGADGKMALNTNAVGPENSASDADMDVYMALKMAARLKQIGIWTGSVDYKQAATDLISIIGPSELINFGGETLFLPSMGWGCDQALVDGICTALAINPAYFRAYASAVASDYPGFYEASVDGMEFLQQVFDQFGGISDWVRVTAKPEGGINVEPSQTFPGSTGQGFDGIRGAMAARGGDGSIVLAQQHVGGMSPSDLEVDWGATGLTPDIVRSMAYLWAVSTQDGMTIAPHSEALKAGYNSPEGSEEGYFSSYGVADYYANSLGIMAGVDTYTMYLLGL
ncbi:MAG: glycosyl hydrolase family 8 [Candidatus Saganbacteria bacterium]|nr:glycosyl hydrolase family 8 [Candidatus Saganbacteria bacterium]